MSKLQPHAAREGTSNSYVFVTRQTSSGVRDYAGWGYVGVVCSGDHRSRINLNRGNKRVMSFALVSIHLKYSTKFFQGINNFMCCIYCHPIYTMLFSFRPSRTKLGITWVCLMIVLLLVVQEKTTQVFTVESV